MTILDRSMHDYARTRALGEGLVPSRPAYARQLLARLASGWRPADRTLYVAVGPQCWELTGLWKGDQWRAYIALPESDTSDLSIAKGWPCIVYSCGATNDQLTAVAANLVRAGAELAIGEIGGRYVSFRGLPL